jgi:hypothetical protein
MCHHLFRLHKIQSIQFAMFSFPIQSKSRPDFILKFTLSSRLSPKDCLLQAPTEINKIKSIDILIN